MVATRGGLLMLVGFLVGCLFMADVIGPAPYREPCEVTR